jgi:hypothetical protein
VRKSVTPHVDATFLTAALEELELDNYGQPRDANTGKPAEAVAVENWHEMRRARRAYTNTHSCAQAAASRTTRGAACAARVTTGCAAAHLLARRRSSGSRTTCESRCDIE